LADGDASSNPLDPPLENITVFMMRQLANRTAWLSTVVGQHFSIILINSLISN